MERLVDFKCINAAEVTCGDDHRQLIKVYPPSWEKMSITPQTLQPPLALAAIKMNGFI